jgi:hypothetical protein
MHQNGRVNSPGCAPAHMADQFGYSHHMRHFCCSIRLEQMDSRVCVTDVTSPSKYIFKQCSKTTRLSCLYKCSSKGCIFLQGKTKPHERCTQMCIHCWAVAQMLTGTLHTGALGVGTLSCQNFKHGYIVHRSKGHEQ